MITKTSKIYTLAVTRTIVVNAPANTFDEAKESVRNVLRSNAYAEEWATARAQIDLIAVE